MFRRSRHKTRLTDRMMLSLIRDMNRSLSKMIGVALLIGSFSVIAFSQIADSGPPNFGKSDDKDSTRSFKGMLFKMQVEKEKKEFQEMLDRGEEAAKLTEQVEKSFESHGSLTNDDRHRIDDVERLVKKIRSELGGSADDDDDDASEKPSDVVNGVKYLRDSTTKLLSELKNSSRFTISAAAIQSSNAVLKVVRFLRIDK